MRLRGAGAASAGVASIANPANPTNPESAVNTAAMPSAAADCRRGLHFITLPPMLRRNLDATIVHTAHIAQATSVASCGIPFRPQDDT